MTNQTQIAQKPRQGLPMNGKQVWLVDIYTMINQSWAKYGHLSFNTKGEAEAYIANPTSAWNGETARRRVGSTFGS